MVFLSPRRYAPLLVARFVPQLLIWVRVFGLLPLLVVLVCASRRILLDSFCNQSLAVRQTSSQWLNLSNSFSNSLFLIGKWVFVFMPRSLSLVILSRFSSTSGTKMVWLALASHPPRILVRVLNGFLPRRRNRRILMLPLFLRVGILRSSMLASPNRFFRGSILVLCQISIFSPINCRVLRLHAPITAGVSFPV
jgi:hypothetical protein